MSISTLLTVACQIVSQIPYSIHKEQIRQVVSHDALVYISQNRQIPQYLSPAGLPDEVELPSGLAAIVLNPDEESRQILEELFVGGGLKNVDEIDLAEFVFEMMSRRHRKPQVSSQPASGPGWERIVWIRTDN